MLDQLLAIIAPHLCLVCGREGSLWCSPCQSKAPPAIDRCYHCQRLSPGGRTCPSCRPRSALFAVRAVTSYDGVAKQLVWKLKFARAQAAATVMAELMAPLVASAQGVRLAHVPTATSRVRQRGYDQAHLLARCLARQTGLPRMSPLLRIGQAQQREQSRRQRLAQLAAAFQVPYPSNVSGAHIILIDDVVTTGATLEAAAAALKQAGARRVSAIVFAQA